jgi:hypothetical protein
MSDAPQQSGVLPLEAMREITDGLLRSEVVARLGEPFQRLPRDEVQTPSETFAELGSSFQFAADQNLSEVWSYLHDRRGKFQLKDRVYTYLGFEGEVLREANASYVAYAERALRGINTSEARTVLWNAAQPNAIGEKHAQDTN